ncbi:MAG: hypothetical protein JNM56_07995, partial [Planctomycetia bacterium]|nr:hypothetical protein [Planctomycetia bacterium]
WGTDRSQRPRNWHRQMHDLLTSLVLLRWLPADREAAPEHFSLMQKRWMVLESVRVLETQPDEASKSETSCCPPTCPWHRSRRRHRHYQITVGAGFLGGLTAFATEVEHQFDFHPELAGQFAEMRAFVEQRDDINTTEKRALLKQGQEELKDEQRLRYLPIVAVPLLLMLYGDRLGLRVRHRRLVRAVVRETTRANKTRQLDRADHGQIIRSRRVPGKHRKHLVACPHLDESKEYIGFNGNGKLWGRGYSITSWMERCDSALVTEQSSADAARQEVLRFLKNLSHVADRLGIVVAGYRDGDWFRLSELHLLLGTGDLHKALHGLQLRLFAEQDYAQRWRRLVADVLTAPGNDQQDPAVAVLDLRTRLAQAGISHQQAAGHLNKSRPFVSLVLEGKKSCPAPVRAQLEALLQGRGPGS